MNIFDNIIFDVIILLFPLVTCIIYDKYNNIYDKNKSNICEDFSLITSFYLLFKFNVDKTYLLMNLPLILAYLKHKNNVIIILSLLCCILLSNGLLIPILLEYLLYYVIYNLKMKPKVFLVFFVILKSILYILFRILTNTFIINDLLIILSFIIVSYIVIYLYNKINNVLNFEKNIKELEKEKNLRMSLFKITHEIKNPITVCKGYLDMFDINDKKKSKKYTDILKNEINRVLILLEDFLSINKIKIEKDIIDLNLLLEDTTNNFMPILKEKHIDSIFNISKDELFIEADYNRLKQVFINIIKNSIESIKHDGLLTIYLNQDKNNITINFEDNGIGMDSEELEKIKEPFFTTKSNGTGLGVYLSNQIINAHEGSIEYISNKNIGTKTIITLPYKEMIF